MKGKITIILFAAFLLSTPVQSQELETTRDSIIHVINQETYFFATGQYEKWKDLWVHSPKALHTGASKDGFGTRQTWESINASLRPYIQDPDNNVAPDKLNIRRDTFTMIIKEDMAFAYFISSDNLSPDVPINDKMESRVLLREDGEWKIIYVNTIEISSYEEDQE